jgi:CRISPR type III-B/RAMP module-associated protein Cmr5
MKNLEQIRAANALAKVGDLKRAAVSKLPAMILGNGLLATAAFCRAEGGGENRKDMKIAMDHTAAHLVDRDMIKKGLGTTDGLIQDLSQRKSIDLQRATSEALAYISYLKRFAQKD